MENKQSFVLTKIYKVTEFTVKQHLEIMTKKIEY